MTQEFEKRVTRRLLAGGLGAFALTRSLPASAQDVETDSTNASNTNDVKLPYPLVEGTTYTVPFDDGVVDRRSGLHIEALAPTLDSSGDPVARARINAENKDATRKAQVCFGKKVGTDRYRVQGCHEYVWNNSGTDGMQPKDGDPYQSCSAGGSTVGVTIVSGKRSGDNPRTDRSQEVTLATTCP